MGSFAMPVSSAMGPAAGPPKSGPTPFRGGLGPLYAGSQNSTGMQMPVPSTPAGPTSSAPASSGLSATPNPGAPGVPSGPVGSNTGTMSGLTPTQAGDVLKGNQGTYGTGAGALLTNYMQTGAGYNGPLAQQAISSTDTAMQQQINTQYGSLQTSLANAGLSPNSSASALAQSGFLSNASAQENMIAAQQYTQMYSQSQQDYLTALQSELGISNSNTSVQNAGSLMSGISGLLSGSGTNNFSL